MLAIEFAHTEGYRDLDLVFLVAATIAIHVVVIGVGWRFIPRAPFRARADVERSGEAASAFALAALSFASEGVPWNEPLESHREGTRCSLFTALNLPTDGSQWIELVHSHLLGGSHWGDWEEVLDGTREPDGLQRATLEGWRNWRIHPRKNTRSQLLPKTLAGFRLGLAIHLIALCSARGHIEPARAERLYGQVSAQARKTFASWEDYGASWLLGLWLLRSESEAVRRSELWRYESAVEDYKRALDGECSGPWAELHWAGLPPRQPQSMPVQGE